MRAAWTALGLSLWLAHAHASTSGRIEGTVWARPHRGARTGVAGATVTARSGALPGPLTVESGDGGAYRLESLPPGVYRVSAAAPALGTALRENVTLSSGRTLRLDLDLAPPPGEGEIVVSAPAPSLDIVSTESGGTITPEMAQDLPNYRLLSYALQFVPGNARPATEQPSFLGATAAENSWIVDGVYAGSVLTGAGSAAAIYLPTKDVQEIAVATGGFSAETGRAGGAVIGVVTRGGGDRMHGSLEFGWTGRALSAAPVPLAGANDAIATATFLARYHVVGLDVGGFLVPGRLWFRVGWNAPRRVKRWERTVRRATGFDDADGDGRFDPRTERLRFRTEAVSSVDSSNNLFQPTLRLDAAVSDAHALSLVHHATYNRILGNADVLGAEARGDLVCVLGETVFDGTLTKLGWTGRTPGGALVGEAFLALAGDRVEAHAWPVSQGRRVQALASESGTGMPLALFEPRFAEDPGTDWPDFPVYAYARGGYGAEVRRFGRRWQASLSATAYPRAWGLHRLRAGTELLLERFSERVGYLGGALEIELHSIPTLPSLHALIERYRTGTDPRSDRASLTHPWVDATIGTRTVAAYVQDDWAVRRNLTVKLGWRIERAGLGDASGREAFALLDPPAPRLGVLWDWTDEGRAKLYAAAGRYAQALPLAVNRYAFTGDFDALYVGEAGDPNSPAAPYAVVGGRALLARERVSVVANACATGTACAPYRTESAGAIRIGGPAVDALTVGYEQEIAALGLALGARGTIRSLVRAIENVYLDGTTPVLGNPGQGPLAQGFLLDSAGYPRTDANGSLVGLPVARPRRDYRALSVTLRRPVARGWQFDASYTLSSLSGSYAGPDPSEAARGPLTPDYDVPELMLNRDGPLPDDARHAVTLFAAYRRAVSGGMARAGAGFVARSGGPTNATGPHFLLNHGDGSVFLLPRGAGPRLPWTRSLDLQVSYAFRIGEVSLELVADLFNAFDWQPATAVDERFTTRAALSNVYLFDFYGVRPVLSDPDTAARLGATPRTGVSSEDLRAHPEWVTVVTPYGTRPLDPRELNPDFGRPTRRQDPRFLALTLRLHL